MNGPPRRAGIRPPQPVDVNNPQWVAMFYQWIIDTLTHLDLCMDETKESHNETRIEIATWMTAAKNFDADFDARLQTHINEHHEIDRVAKAKRSVWQAQGDAVRDGFRFVTQGTVIAAMLGVLKLLGIL